MPFSQAFKVVLCSLLIKKKDKLSIRLLGKEINLANRLFDKIHEDYRLYFHKQVVQLGISTSKRPVLIKAAIAHGLDGHWFIGFDISEDIAEIHKDLRQSAYLK